MQSSTCNARLQTGVGPPLIVSRQSGVRGQDSAECSSEIKSAGFVLVRPGQRQVRGRVELNIVRLFRVIFSRVEASSSLKIGDFVR